VCDLSLLTWVPVDYEGVNRFFGTSLKPGDFRVYRTPPFPSRLMDALPTPAESIKMRFMQKWCRSLDATERFDVLISTNNEVDFGRRGIQYVHFPWAYLVRPQVDFRWYHTGATLGIYRALCASLSEVSTERIRDNLTLVNSAFIADKVCQAYGANSIVLSPPVPGGFPGVRWTERQDAFLGIGRFSPEKRWEVAVDIVRRLRESGRNVTLTLICTPDSTSCESHIRKLALEHANWMTLHVNCSRQELTYLVTHHRYGIHPMQEEHFGIAPAELQRGGCLPFVHRSGGPMEIVGGDERLMFETVEDAVAKVARVLDSSTLQHELLEGASRRANEYTNEQFVERLRQIVDEFSG
jgi:glycosyltransferase involved in cell wall biosynthesis